LLALVTFGTGFFQRFLDADTNEFIVVRALGVTILVAGIARSRWALARPLPRSSSAA